MRLAEVYRAPAPPHAKTHHGFGCLLRLAVGVRPVAVTLTRVMTQD